MRRSVFKESMIEGFVDEYGQPEPANNRWEILDIR
jgi:hypothetical protein